MDRFGVEAFDGCLIAIDEFHHVSANSDNKLGIQLGQFIARDKVHIIAMTGSYFRGDAEAVLAPHDEAKFEVVTYTYYEQLNGYQYLKQLDIGYYFYTGSYTDKIRASEECRAVLADKDKHGLLTGEPTTVVNELDNLDDDALLSELGVLDSGENDITKLTHVKSRAEIKTAEEIAKRNPCLDFDTFKPLFVKVQEELASGIRVTRKFKDDAQIRQGDFFILGGQKVYVAEMGVEFVAEYGRSDRRLRVIYDNGTESDILMRSLQRALNRDETSRRIIDTYAGPLFSDVIEDGDRETGTIYVLRSKSDHPLIKEHRDVIHKIGVTSGSIEKRIINAKLDPTFLMADVEIVATYELSNINRIKLENLIHRFFEAAKLDIEIMDRFGNPVVPREWFLVPLFVINETIKKIRDGSIVNYRYDPNIGKVISI